MPLDARKTLTRLTEPQRQCILDLSDDWKSRGYSTVHADILYTLGDSDLYPGLPTLVESRFQQQPGVYTHYQHRLTDQGLEIQSVLLNDGIPA